MCNKITFPIVSTSMALESKASSTAHEDPTDYRLSISSAMFKVGDTTSHIHCRRGSQLDWRILLMQALIGTQISEC
jgi:hypothetical protein